MEKTINKLDAKVNAGNRKTKKMIDLLLTRAVLGRQGPQGAGRKEAVPAWPWLAKQQLPNWNVPPLPSLTPLGSASTGFLLGFHLRSGLYQLIIPLVASPRFGFID